MTPLYQREMWLGVIEWKFTPAGLSPSVRLSEDVCRGLSPVSVSPS